MIIVTGAAGLIGSAVIRYLNERGHNQIILVDDLKTGEKWKNLVGKNFLTLISKNTLFSWLEGRASEVTAFIHLGACSNTLECDADYLFENNTRFSQKLAEYALQNGHRFIYASSAATYGDGSLGFSDDHDGLEELRPLNMYGFSKHLFDLWAKREGVLDQVVGLKYFNVFGPNEWHKGKMASAILQLLPQLQKEGAVRLFRSNTPRQFADGEQQRDFIYVKDAVRMTCAFLDNSSSGIFNIGRGAPTSWNQLARALFHALKRPPQIHYIDMPEALVGKYQNYTCAEMEKAKKALGESAQCGLFDDQVAEYVHSHLLTGERW